MNLPLEKLKNKSPSFCLQKENGIDYDNLMNQTFLPS